MSVAINDSFSLFMYPFRIDSGTLKLLESDSKWRRSSISPDPSFFFPHINSFFTHNIGVEGESIDSNQVITFELASSDLSEGDKEKLFLHKNLFLRSHRIQAEGTSIGFSFFNDSGLLSPKLFIVPLTDLGILTFGVSLTEKESVLDQLIDLNYKLRVFAAGRIQAIETERKDHPNAQPNEEKIASLIGGEQTEATFKWDLPLWIDYLLSDISDTILILSPSRLQAFTYVSLDEKLEDRDLDIALFRLRRVYSAKYLPSESFLHDRKEISQTFDQLIYGASAEGAVVLAKKDDKAFLRNYRNTVLQRTLWTYILAFHQRFAMLAAANDTSTLFHDNIEPTTAQLSGLIDRISKIQLKCMFNEISHYTQQNEFYYLALDNLRIDSLFNEIKEEVDELNKILTEKWREQERVQHIEEEKKQKKNQRKIEILLTLLIVPQIWLALLSTNVSSWQEFVDKNSLWVHIASGAMVTAIVVVVVRLFVRRSS